MRLVFCGTPSFAVPTLKALVDTGHAIELVVTQPDRPQGRTGVVVAPPVKQVAVGAGLAVLQPEKIKNSAEFRELLETIAPDAIIVVAYGRIIPKWMIDLPLFGNINLHASLLPKYRGAAPIQWAIANGETVTGATTMRIDEGLDTGEMLLQRQMAIGADQTSEEIFPLLAEAGAVLMIETLERLAAGTIKPRRQGDGATTLAPILRREDGLVDFSRTATDIYNRWRGFQPWPGAYTSLGGKKLTLHALRPVEDAVVAGAVAGEVRVEGDALLVGCGGGTSLRILELQVEGKRRLPVAEFLRGYPNFNHLRLG